MTDEEYAMACVEAGMQAALTRYQDLYRVWLRWAQDTGAQWSNAWVEKMSRPLL